MKKTVIYCRVSTREQAEYGYSIRDQEDKLIKYCELVLGIAKDELLVYLEMGVSASTLKRQKLQEILDLVKKRKISRIVIHNLDRMFRNMKDFLIVLELLEKYNVELVSLKEQIETQSAMGRFQVSFFVLMAEWERNTIKERTIRGLDQSAKEGNYAKGGKPPFGYLRDNNKLKINNEECEIIQLMFKMIASEKYNVNQLNKYMKENYPNILKWSDKQTRKILSDEVYIGTFYNERIRLLNQHEPIVTKRMFEATQKALKKRSHSTRHTYIANGLIKCYQCESILYAEPSYNKSGVLYKYYYCKNCNKRVSEKEILKELEPELYNHSILEGEYNNINLEKFKKIAIKEKELNEKVINHEITDTDYFVESSRLSHLKQALIDSTTIENQEVKKYFQLNIKDKRKVLKKVFNQVHYDFKNKKIITKKN